MTKEQIKLRLVTIHKVMDKLIGANMGHPNTKQMRLLREYRRHLAAELHNAE